MWVALTASRLPIFAIFCRLVVVVVLLLCRRVAESPSRGACRLQLFTPFRWLIATVLLFNVLFRLFFPPEKGRRRRRRSRRRRRRWRWVLALRLLAVHSSRLDTQRWLQLLLLPAPAPSSSSGCGSSVFIYVFHLFNSKRRLPGQLCSGLLCVFSVPASHLHFPCPRLCNHTPPGGGTALRASDLFALVLAFFFIKCVWINL